MRSITMYNFRWFGELIIECLKLSIIYFTTMIQIAGSRLLYANTLRMSRSDIHVSIGNTTFSGSQNNNAPTLPTYQLNNNNNVEIIFGIHIEHDFIWAKPDLKSRVFKTPITSWTKTVPCRDFNNGKYFFRGKKRISHK